MGGLWVDIIYFQVNPNCLDFLIELWMRWGFDNIDHFSKVWVLIIFPKCGGGVMGMGDLSSFDPGPKGPSILISLLHSDF